MISMGLEAECTVRVGRKVSSGKALLESDALIFRGDARYEIAFGAMTSASVEGDALVVKTPDLEVRFELGAAVAERWLRLIKEPKGLFEKLELLPDSRVAVVDVRDSLFLTALRERIPSIADGRVPQGATVIFFGAETRAALGKLQLLRARMIDSGVLWVIRPKGSKAISEGDVFDAAKGAGLVDTKVVSFSKTHTAHKFMIPVELRGRPLRVRPPIVSLPPPPPGTAAAAKGGKAAEGEASTAAKSGKAASPGGGKPAKAAGAKGAKHK
jgi:hypothetical protein